ncbi:hypothetical protein AKJ41_05210 [candidate division MSBL1 archaeon SCGC-AAA259O05]|uniref:Cyclophilin TM1367-like domain-containing protein n=1 Tax=candidate division MSBL1 archaeon SCGC-AAA259O05 TaxID=1698271 RepID=A0A133UZG4_9EURY|nr:hypothetical protein AKJ41_05210 [candidate division MSBL1 archaeon SCGC-AAA259O05]
MLLEEERPETCEAIWDALPFKGEAKLYKEEIYFSIPVEIVPENATSSTERGDISYWPEGPAFCVFFGDSQPASPVNTFARVDEDVGKFSNVSEGDVIVVEKVE